VRGKFHLLSGSLDVLPILEGLLVREQLAHMIDGLLGVGTQGHSEVQGVVLINAITHNKAVVLKQVRVVSLPVVVVDLLPGFDIPAGAVHHDEVRVGVRVAPPPELVDLP
jgi:NAD(P)H-hydrate repair Nnr-like enzyme with NAD(P)H-hydrate epimerase domain